MTQDLQSDGAQGAPWRVIAAIAAFGVAVRAVLLLWASPLEIQSDESNYLYLAAALQHFGVYLDQQRYLWPPAYPWLLGEAIGAFGADGLQVVRWMQVAASSVIGVMTMLFAWRLISRRAAAVAGILWVIHLPLGAYTHLLWSEPLFLALLLPALWHLLRALDVADGELQGSVTRRLLASGVLFGLALYVKEWPLFLLPLVSVVVLVRSLRVGVADAVARATLVPLVALVVTMPWTLRNHEVYGRVVVAGATLGENAHVGLNARYMNFDLNALRKVRLSRGLDSLETRSRRAFVAAPAAEPGSGGSGPGWTRRDDIVHPIDRQKAHVAAGIEYALDHPGWAVRTRVKKLSDVVTPMSFFTRTYAMDRYPPDSPLSGGLRAPLVLYALSFSALLMLLAAAGYFFTLPGGSGRDIVTVTIAYVLATALLVAMSRFRAPIEPFLIVLAAGFLAHGPATRSVPRAVGMAITVLALAGLWWVSLPETVEVARMAMGGGS
ncbi:MAG: glycosyltransferase family 39 protein [Planctomycetota bacterium]